MRFPGSRLPRCPCPGRIRRPPKSTCDQPPTDLRPSLESLRIFLYKRKNPKKILLNPYGIASVFVFPLRRSGIGSQRKCKLHLNFFRKNHVKKCFTNQNPPTEASSGEPEYSMVSAAIWSMVGQTTAVLFSLILAKMGSNLQKQPKIGKSYNG